MNDLLIEADPEYASGPPPLAEYRRSIRETLAGNPDVFSSTLWDVPGRVPPGREAVALLGRAGLFVPASSPPRADADAGDHEPPWRYSAALHEELALLPVGAVVLTQVEVVARLLAAFSASAAQARRAIDGELLGALAVTEPGGGLDFDAMTTTMQRNGEAVVVDGEKWFSSNSPFADELLVLVRDQAFGDMTPGRHTLLRIPASTPGVSVCPLETLGHRGITGHIRLDSVRLDPESVLGTPGTGLFTLMKHWVHERVMVALRMTAMADGLLTLMLRVAPQNGCDPRTVAELFAEVAQEQAACERALDLLVRGSCAPSIAAGCKLRAAAVLRRMAETALQLEAELAALEPEFAGLNPADPALAERALRDAAGLALAGGSNEALLMVIARELR